MLKNYLKVLNQTPVSGVENRMKHKTCEIKKFLIEQKCLIEANDSEFIHDIACFSEVGYSMRQEISEPLVRTIQLDNGNVFDFSLSPYHPTVQFPFDIICIRKNKEEFDDIVFIFDIGGCINGIKSEYKSDIYCG